MRGFWIKCLELKKKKIWYRTWMGYCPIELKARLGAGLGTGRAGGVRGTQARCRRHGRAGVGRASARALGAGRAGARGARGRRTLGWRAAGERGRRARTAGMRHGRVAGRHAGRGRRAGHGRLGGLGATWACSWANGLCTWCT